jgi:predicted nucleic acid-binding protein
VRNGLRRRRFNRAQADALASHMAGLDTRIVAPWHHEASRYLQLAMAHDLTPYDAIYIDLCLSERAELATCDAELVHAALRVGIRIHS